MALEISLILLLLFFLWEGGGEWEDVYLDCSTLRLNVTYMYCICVGMCEVEPSEKGWYIKYVDRSPETLARQAVSTNK